MSKRRLWIVLVGAAILVLTALGSAAAADPVTGGRDRRCVYPMCGGYAVFHSTTFRGAVLAELRPDDTAQLTVIVKWEGPDFDALTLVGSSRACGQPHVSAAKVAGKIEYPNVSFDEVLVPLSKPLEKLRSFRFFEPGPGGAQLACARAVVHLRIDGPSPVPDGAFGRFDRPEVQGLAVLRVTTPPDQAVLTYALLGVIESVGTKYTMFGSKAACGSAHNQTDLEFLRVIAIEEGGVAFGTRTVETGDLSQLRSIRLVKGEGTGGERVACVSASKNEVAIET